jgi:hypothetical protein
MSRARSFYAKAYGCEGTDRTSVVGTQLRLMGEHGVEIPLWDETGPLTTDPALLVEDLAIDAELVVRTIAWGYMFDMGGDDATYRAVGRALARTLQQALPQYELVYEP